MDDAKTILLGVTGGIAAYKSCEILRGLQKRGHRVKVVMTEHATRFIDPLTFRALTGEAVGVSMFDDEADPIPHITLAEECDLFLIAPCTANVIAKLACGIADDLLTSTALACTAPLLLAPAMNVHMYEAPVTQANLSTLRQRGVRFVDAEDGYLACGDVGRGRLAEVDDIVDAACAALEEAERRERDLEGKHVLVTAGPTEEPIDAVRFISNRSSGKMGYALAAAAAARGARVTLVSGPVALDAPFGVTVVNVRTAREMLDAADEAFAHADIAVFTAAVADMRPAKPASGKLKKGRDDASLAAIELIENPDILATLANEKRDGQCVVGFAAETDDVLENARKKLLSKHADIIVANEVGEGIGFGTDDDKAWIMTESETVELPLMAKTELAERILDAAIGVQRNV